MHLVCFLLLLLSLQLHLLSPSLFTAAVRAFELQDSTGLENPTVTGKRKESAVCACTLYMSAMDREGWRTRHFLGGVWRGLSQHLTLVILEMGTRRRALIGRTSMSLRDEEAPPERNRTGCNGRVHGFRGAGRGSVDGGLDTSSGAVGPGQAQNNSYLACQPGPPIVANLISCSARWWVSSCNRILRNFSAEPRRLTTRTFLQNSERSLGLLGDAGMDSPGNGVAVMRRGSYDDAAASLHPVSYWSAIWMQRWKKKK